METQTLPSERDELARLALGAALRHPDVIAGVAGPNGTCRTQVGGERMEGVSVVASRGGYDVYLTLRTRMVPLRELAEELRGGVLAAARMSDRAGLPSSVAIRFDDLGMLP